MIYLVSNQQQLLNDNIHYSVISIKESLEYISNWEVIQFDTETTGRNPHICKILCMQFGNKKADMQIVVDCTTVDPLLYKELLESKLLIGQNLKFDLQFLYNIGIIPTKVWDTMIVEQLLYLGYTYTPISPEEYKEYKYDFPYLMHLNKKTGDYYIELSFSLKAIAQKRLGINIDKTVRGEIIWRGLDTEVIIYAAGDVTYLEDIKESQEKDCESKKCKVAASLENNFVPAISYLEFCGIRLDETKWRKKIQDNEDKLNTSLDLLNEWLVEKSNNIPELRKFITVNLQGSLWDGFDLKPKISLNWDSSKQVIELVKLIGFDVNCGEIVFDRLCAETLAKRFPNLSITFCVKGGNATNDATREDALAVGIEFPIVDTGLPIAGVPVEILEGPAKQALEEADVILSKGQANVETLYGCGHNIFYLFLIKCQRFQTIFGKEKLTPMFLRERKE